MSTTRTHFTFRVDTWTPDGESIVEHVAGVEDYRVALATFLAACQRWPGTPITLRQGARLIEDNSQTVTERGVDLPSLLRERVGSLHKNFRRKFQAVTEEVRRGQTRR